jgi:hypothetical protein
MGIDMSRFKKNKPSQWVDWLSDDPLPQQPVQPQVHQPYSAPQPVGRPVVDVRVAAPQRPVVLTHAAPPGVAAPITPIAPPQPQQASKTMPVARPPVGNRSAFASRPVRSPAPQVFQPSVSVAPPATQSMQPVMAAPQRAAAPSTSAQPAAAVSIQISMPKVKLPALPVLPYKRIGYWAAGGALGIALLSGGWMTYRHFTGKPEVAVKGAKTVSTSPTFDTLAPESKPQLGEGADSQNTAYDGTRGLYSYKDTLMGFPIIVSQQTLPDDVKKDPKKLETVAKSMGGTLSSFETAFGKAYMTTSDKKGEGQRGVFIYRDVMVFVQSYRNFDDDTWKFYIESLR